MLMLFSILILIALAFQVFPAGLGINSKAGFNAIIWCVLIMWLGQVLMLYLGYSLGLKFTHLLSGYKSIVVFIGLFLIGLRLVMDAFKVRKGERTYQLDGTQSAILASLALGVNTFLAGIIFTLLKEQSHFLTQWLAIFTMVMLGVSVMLKPDKITLALSSLLYFAGGIIFVVSSVYLGFFIS